MKHFLPIIALFLLITPGGLLAQDQDAEDRLIQSLKNTGSYEEGSLANINLKNGVGNRIDIQQYNRQLANVNQEGDFNEVMLYMAGDQNSIIVNQIGDQHQVEIDLEGEANHLGVTQRGYGNKLYLDYFDVRENNATFIQDGHNIEVEHRAIGLEGLNYTVEFKGSNMNIKIVDLNNFLNY